MEFVPNIKAKRRCPKFYNIKPFPIELTKKPQGIFTGFSIQICEGGRVLHEHGYYGKIRKMSDSDDQEETLVLELEEAYFLAYILHVIEIVSIENVAMSQNETFHEFRKIKENFAFTLAAYVYLKSKGWVVKSGLKFGGDFLLYKQGMQFHHASFIVHVTEGEKRIESKDLQGMQRVAEASDKDVLLLSVYAPPDTDPANYHDYIHSFAVTETIPRRFELKKHVQNKPGSSQLV